MRRAPVVVADHDQRRVDAAGAGAEGLDPAQHDGRRRLDEARRRALARAGVGAPDAEQALAALEPAPARRSRSSGSAATSSRSTAFRWPSRMRPTEASAAATRRTSSHSGARPARSARTAPIVAVSAPASPSAAQRRAPGSAGSRSSASAPAAIAASAWSSSARQRAGAGDADPRLRRSRSRALPVARLGDRSPAAGPRRARLGEQSRGQPHASPRSRRAGRPGRARRASGPRSPSREAALALRGRRASARGCRRASRGCRSSSPRARRPCSAASRAGQRPVTAPQGARQARGRTPSEASMAQARRQPRLAARPRSARSGGRGATQWKPTSWPPAAHRRDQLRWCTSARGAIDEEGRGRARSRRSSVEDPRGPDRIRPVVEGEGDRASAGAGSRPRLQPGGN